MKSNGTKKRKIAIKVYLTPQEHADYLRCKPERTTLNRYLTDCLYLFHYANNRVETHHYDEEFNRIMDKLNELEKTRKNALDDEANLIESAKNKYKPEYEPIVHRIMQVLRYSPIALSELEIAPSVHENADIVFYVLTHLLEQEKIEFEKEFFVLKRDKKRNWYVEKL